MTPSRSKPKTHETFWLAALLALVFVNGCAAMVDRATGRLADNLTAAILDQNDPQTVRDGGPAYLLMVDGLIEGSPQNVTLLLAGAKLYGAYVGAFVDEELRAKRLSQRARDYGRRALCAEWAALCAVVDKPFATFDDVLAGAKKDHTDVLYGYAVASATWLQAHSDDWKAVAELPKIEAAIRKVLELDDGYDGGGAHLYMGVLLNQRPPALGGKPEQGRKHFEKAIALSGGRNLMAKVMFAQSYARLVFNRDLHDRLLREVLAARVQAPRLTLTNVLAQRRATDLLQQSAGFF